MNPKSFAIYLLAVVQAVTGFLASTQAETRLPSLKASGDVTQGRLSNGIHYYVVSNKTWTGSADVSLVQKAGVEDETPATSGMASVLARGSLSGLPHFTSNSPFQFLRRASVWPEDEGYVKVQGDATVYRFRDISTSHGGTALDSTLLLVFDIVSAKAGEMAEYYSPDSQAVIVSGDVDGAEMVQKMEMLSMMVTKRGGMGRRPVYEWKSSGEPMVVLAQDSSSPGVNVSYRFRRIPEEEMATVMPLMTTRYMDELRVLVEWRLRKAMYASGIPCGHVRCDYVSGAMQPGDETFSVSVGCGLEDVPKVVGLTAGVLSDIDKSGLTSGQHRDVMGAANLWAREHYGGASSSSRWVDKCIGNFLYGASLASDADEYGFFSGKNLRPDTTASLFNSFAQALLSDGKDMTLRIDGDTSRLPAAAALDLFRKGWSAGSGMEWRECADEVQLPRLSSRKVKLRSSAEETLLGGALWTLDNGIRVVYKQMPTEGSFRYSWLVKGGYSRMSGLSEREGTHVADMLTLATVSGIPAPDFASMLSARGISMSVDVTYSELMLSGSAPSSRLRLLLQSLNALAYNRAEDGQAFDYYRRCERLGFREEDLQVGLDGLTGWGGAGRLDKELPDDFLSRSHSFFDEAFSRMNDGVLILVGDLEEEQLRKCLTECMGTFRTSASPSSRVRVGAGREMASVSKSAVGDKPGAAIAMSSPINFTTENYVAASIASWWMADKISEAVAQCGWRSESSWDLTMFPDESLRLQAVLTPVPSSGLPASMLVEASPEVVLEAAKAGLSEAASQGLSASELAAAKDFAIRQFDVRKNDPEAVCKMLSLRYSYGKDIVTDFSSRAASVDSRRVNGLVRDMVRGGSAAYLISAPAVPVEEPWVPDVPELAVQRPAVPDGALAYPLNGETVPFEEVDLSSIRPAPFVPGKFVISRVLPADTLSVEVPEIDIDALFSNLGLQ